MRRFTVPALVAGLVVALLSLPMTWSAAAQQDDMTMGGTADGKTVSTVDQARQQATDYLSGVGLTNLTVGDVLPFATSFYVAVVDPTSGNGAFELRINRDGGGVHPEPGPTMMWNTEYSPMFGTNGKLLLDAMASTMMGSMMGGDMSNGTGMGGDMDRMGGDMMGNGQGMMEQEDTMGNGAAAEGDCPEAAGYQAGATQPLAQPLTTDEALARAQTWLTSQLPNATASGPVAFPGYVTVKIEQSGQVVGLLSIQTSTGAVWQHVWHGAAID